MSPLLVVNRVRQSFAAWIALLAFCLLAACSGNSPEAAVKNFYGAIAANHMDEATEYVLFKDANGKDMTALKPKVQMGLGMLNAEIQQNGGLDSISTKLVSQESGKATVEAVLTYKNKKTYKEQPNLVQESGKWKINPN